MQILNSLKRQTARRRPVKQPWVDLVALLALVFVIARIPLTYIPEPLPGLAMLGELLSDLSLAIIAAWLFNLLVIEMPSIRRRERMHAAYIDDLRLIAGKARLLYKALCLKKLKHPVEAPTVDDMTEVFKHIRRDSRAPAYTFRGRLTSDTLDWVEYLERHLDDLHDAIARVTPGLPYLDWEIATFLPAISNNAFEYFIRNASRYGFIAPNLEELAEPLHAFITDSEPMFEYVQKIE